VKTIIQKCLVEECDLVTAVNFCPVHRDEEEYECDACGEVKHDDGKGEDIIGYIYVKGAGRVARDDEWICSGCVAQREEMEISRAEEGNEW